MKTFRFSAVVAALLPLMTQSMAGNGMGSFGGHASHGSFGRGFPHQGRDHRFFYRHRPFFFGFDFVAEELQVFRSDPCPDIVVAEDDRTAIGEDTVSGDVVEVVVGVDHEFDGKVSEGVNLSEESFGSSLVFEGINYGDAVIAHDETSVCASVPLGVVNRRPDVRADKFHLEWRLGVRGLRRNCCRRKAEK